MPGIGVRTAPRILLDVGDASQFPTAGQLAALICLSRRRCDVLFVMLPNQEPTAHPPQHPTLLRFDEEQ